MQQGNISEKIVKIVNTEETSFISFKQLEEFQWNFQEDVACHKKQGFTLFLENKFLEKPEQVKLTPPLAFLGLTGTHYLQSKSLIAIFRNAFASIDKVFVLAAEMGTKLSFYGI